MLNANEPEATIVEILVEDGACVAAGDIVFTIETTKAAADVEVEADGYFRPSVTIGETLRVGDVIGYVTEMADEPLPKKEEPVINDATSANELRITGPARALAERNGFVLEQLPKDRLITESFIRELIKVPLRTDPPESDAMIVYGAGGHAKALIEMIRSAGKYQIAAIIDDDPGLKGGQVFGIPIIGGKEELEKTFSAGIEIAANGVGGIIDQRVRKMIFERLISENYFLPSVIHPNATVEVSATIGLGTQVFANAYVGSDVILDAMCMVNTGAVVSHDCKVGSFSHIAPGALLAGGVTVEQDVLVGMGVTTAIGVTIHEGARIGNGAVILKDVPAKKIVAVGEIWR